MVDYARAIWLPNDNFFADRNGLKPRWIICHGTAGGTSARAIAQYFQGTQGGRAPVSSHYIIGQDGTVVQTVAEKDGSWANGVLTSGYDAWWDQRVNPNNVTISIEHCKPSSDNSDTLTTPQKTASFELIHDICQRWNIPMRAADPDGGITGHFSIDPINRRNCPGMFPWEQLWAFLKEGTDMLDLNDPVVQMFFTDGGNGTWKCKKNNFIIGHGILNFYQKFGGDAFYGLTHLGLPLSNEIGDPNHQGVVIQEFERATVRYDPSHLCDMPPGSGGVYLIHIEQDPRYMQLQTQIATLQQSVLAKELQTEQAKLAQIKQIASS
jgi:N-acetyl-anhydromuramyl-L-alanine amidase AmpD